MKELIKRLRNTPNWKRESFDNWKDCVLTFDRAPFEAADALEQQAKQIEELAAALAGKDEALEAGHSTIHVLPPGRPPCSCSQCRFVRLREKALSLQPHAALVAKIKADEIRRVAELPYSIAYRNLLREEADRIERGEVK